MGTTWPSDVLKTFLDQATDDVAQARGQLEAMADYLNQIDDVIGALAILNIATDGGLEVDSKSAGTPDELSVKLQSASGLELSASGLRIDLQSAAGLLLESAGLRTYFEDLTEAVALAVGDYIPYYSSIASGTKQRRISLANWLSQIAGDGLSVSGKTLELTTTPAQWGANQNIFGVAGPHELTSGFDDAILIDLVFEGLGSDGSNEIYLELGSGTYATTSNGCVGATGTGGASVAWSGGPIRLTYYGATSVGNVSGIVRLAKHNDNNWSVAGQLGIDAVAAAFYTQGRVNMPGGTALDRLKITCADTFDAGGVYVRAYA